ncbi:auxin efflux carrier component 7-like [Phalaenopsis equestris]|uniref:auxin efflux carrier component 7-like n=1 Tax=Phalaenopsis equestris TaxID=78828 RepID=UPI0009E3A20A|nr:auxin efflux carrier component 7-like [Phalaenopsis equestris]
MSPKELYNVLSAVFPLYFAMFLAYSSIKYFNLFTPEQCSGINRFVAIFAIPLLSFNFITKINPFHMHFLFIAADSLSKLFVLFLLFCWSRFFKKGSLDWSITFFSIATLPNTLVMGIPLLKSMYGDEQEDLMIQIVVMQSIVWYTLLLFLFEYRSARNSLMEKMSSDGVGDQERGIGEEELIQVVVCNSSSENETQKSQFVTKVSPELEEEEEVKTAEKLPEIEEQSKQQGVCESSVQVCRREEEEGKEEDEKPQPNKLSMLLILRLVFHKLIRNPNTYASVLGLVWALISSKWNVKKPLIMDSSITILSNSGLGMAMFSLGLFMAMQHSIIPCGKKMATYGMIIRFVAGPAFMAVAAIVLGIRGTILKVSIVQAALPQGIVPFVFAKEYNLHPEMLSTAVIFGMIVSLPVTILYYMVLGS